MKNSRLPPRDQAETLVKVMGQQIHAAVSSARSNTATKDDVTKICARLDHMATKDDIAKICARLDHMATKDDMAKIHAALAGLQTAMRYQLAMMTVLTSAVIALFVKML